MNDANAFPLSWPFGQKRTGYYQKKESRFRVSSFAVARDLLIAELNRFRASDVIISTNIPLRLDGLPKSGYRQPEDVGVAVYFKLPGEKYSDPKRPFVIACDQYRKIEDNMHAVAKTIDALRSIERWGSTDMMNQAFQGFAALPAPKPKDHWSFTLGVSRLASNDDIKTQYKVLAIRYHPDRGGDSAKMAEINSAYEEFKRERGL